jgi:uncharacterized protein YmfQ (DUF2313 family)
MPTVWGSSGGAVLVVDGLGSGMVESAGFETQAVQLLPHGEAWSRRPTSTLRKLVRGLARTFARLDADIQALEREIFPGTADQSLTAWEAFAGLPHACDGDPPITIEDRRAVLVAKLYRSRGLLDRPRARAIAAELGYTSVEFRRTYRPFSCGSRCGAPLAGHEGGWPWHLIVAASPANPDLDATLRCLIKASAVAPYVVTVITE